ncbi:MAG: GNAT family N-acetyltransferase [Proteobacteria bacterium]|nr:GNAT family N-acetyltransferase [Pseudomonadota bacterium]MBU1711266.1 GNAT family N-acetyltransferase [Pseudomonadota bacterium]
MPTPNWRKQNKELEINAEDLHRFIKPGSRIFIGTGCSEPIRLTEQLVLNKRLFTDCELVHFLTLSDNKFFDDLEPSLYRHQAFFVGNSIRQAVNEGKADYIPISLSDIPEMITTGQMRIDVALLQLSPPDKFGFCSLGINVDINRTVFENSKMVIAQINPKMPRTSGDSFVRFDDIAHFVYEETDLLEFIYPEPDETARRIGMHCARIIENGSTLQFGIGDIPNAALMYLKEKQDLSVYSEVISDSIMDLIESGVINCRKSYHPHILTSFAMGSRQLYDYVDENPFIEFRSTETINNIFNIAQNTKQVSINAALSVSITGQVNSDSIGAEIFSGVGGQLDFSRGAALSKGGKPIICLPSVTGDGKKSRIVATLDPAAGVVVPRSEVHYVITEWGIAFLHGKSIRNRVLQMIGIAHPKFRQELLDKAKELNFVYKDQILPQTQDGVVVLYPEEYEWSYTTPEGEHIFFRPVKTTDERMLQELYYELDPEDRRFRFFSPQSTFSHKETQTAVNVDYESIFAMVGLIGDQENQKIVSMGSYYLNHSLNVAEIAFTVAKGSRNQGLTRHMLSRLIDIAKEKRISGFMGEVLQMNDSMLHVLKTSPYAIQFEAMDDTFSFHFKFTDKKSKPPRKKTKK